jgi:hypothetical protein
VLACALLVLAACDGQSRAKAGSSPSQAAAGATATGAGSVRADLNELIELMTPSDQAVTSDITDRRLFRSRELLGQLRAGPKEAGTEALAILGDARGGGRTRPVDVERALLDVAAHAAPAEARPLLEALTTQYGAALELRTEATLLLAQTSPERAIEILEPMVTKARPNQTQPPAEFIVKSWILACDRVQRSPVKELADVATNILMDETARILAVKELGSRPEPLALHALEAILIESTGDGYIRRMAAQGIRDGMPAEHACAILKTVAGREADTNFAQFLGDMLEKNGR